MDIEGLSDLLNRGVFSEQSPRELSLLSIEFPGPAESDPAFFSGGLPGLRPFPNQLAFKLGISPQRYVKFHRIGESRAFSRPSRPSGDPVLVSGQPQFLRHP